MSQNERLDYEIHSVSSFSPPYLPANILTAAPHDPTSRWSTASGHHEYITLKLARPAILDSISFGKLDRVHPCNLSHFVVFVGMRPEKVFMKEVLRNRLQNDTTTERFELDCRVDLNHASRAASALPSQYVRIEVLDAQSPNFNISLWHVALEGQTSTETPDTLVKADHDRRTQLLNQSLLSHLRSSRELLPVYALLQQTLATSSAESSRSTIESFEHPLLTELHQRLVVDGDYDASEQSLDTAYEQGLFSEWERGRGESTGKWELLDRGSSLPSASEPGERRQEKIPSARGGHQLVLAGRKLLCFGGWNGTDTNYNDLWEWDLSATGFDGLNGSGGMGGSRTGSETKRGKTAHSGWILRQSSESGEAEGSARPRGRSCAQLVLDQRSGWAYLLGGMVTTSKPAPSPDSSPTASASVPTPTAAIPTPPGTDQSPSAPIPDESADSTSERKEDPFRSDFWRYKVFGDGEGTWELLCNDTGSSEIAGPKLIFDHQMVISTRYNKLYVFGGKFVQSTPSAVDSGRRTPAAQSGMFEYDLLSQKWTRVNASEPASRVGHSMFIETYLTPSNEEQERLVVIGGQSQSIYQSTQWTANLPLHVIPPLSYAPENTLAPSTTRPDEDEEMSTSIVQSSASTTNTTVQISAGRLASDVQHRNYGNLDPFGRKRRFSELGIPAHSGRGMLPTTFTARALHSSVVRTTARRTHGTEEETIPGHHNRCTVITGLTKTSANIAQGSAKSHENAGGVDSTLNDVYRTRYDVGAKDGVESQWKKVRGAEFSAWSGSVETSAAPVGRYASQVVHDPIEDVYYLFGGNPLGGGDSPVRLGDLWKLTITDPTSSEALRRARFFLRKQRFAELCRTHSTLQALDYLQTVLSPIVDANSPQESLEFSSAMLSVLTAPGKNNLSEDETMEEEEEEEADSVHSSEQQREVYRERVALWKELVFLFDSDVVEPENLLLDLVV